MRRESFKKVHETANRRNCANVKYTFALSILNDCFWTQMKHILKTLTAELQVECAYKQQCGREMNCVVNRKCEFNGKTQPTFHK